MKFTQEPMIERLRHKRWLRKRIDTIKTSKDDPEIDFGRSLLKEKYFMLRPKREGEKAKNSKVLHYLFCL